MHAVEERRQAQGLRCKVAYGGNTSPRNVCSLGEWTLHTQYVGVHRSAQEGVGRRGGQAEQVLRREREQPAAALLYLFTVMHHLSVNTEQLPTICHSHFRPKGSF